MMAAKVKSRRGIVFQPVCCDNNTSRCIRRTQALCAGTCREVELSSGRLCCSNGQTSRRTALVSPPPPYSV